MLKKFFLLLFFIISLTANEKKFTVSYDPDYAPFSYQVDNKPYGLFVEFYKHWAKVNDYELEFVDGKTWDGALSLVKNGEVDFFLGTQAYEDWMKSSKAFYKTKTALFSLKTFKKKIQTIGIIGDDYKEELEKKFSNIKIVSFESYEELISALNRIEVDVIYDDVLAVTDYVFHNRHNHFIKQLEILSTQSTISAISNNIENIKLFNAGMKNVSMDDFQRIEIEWIPNESQRYFTQTSIGTFTPDEKQWIDDNPIIRIGVMNYWPKNNDGENLHTEVLKLINEFASINLVPISYDAWKDGFNDAVKGQYLHGIMGLSWSKEREDKYFYYTHAYNFTPSYIITRKDNTDIKTLEDLINKTIYLKNNSITHKMMLEKSPNTKIIDKDSLEELYKSLSRSKEADALISYFIDESKLDEYDLKIVKEIYDRYGEVAFGIHHNNKYLSSIINKTLKIIPKERLAKVRDKMNFNNQRAIKLSQKEKDFIKLQQPINYVFDPDWEPFEWANGIGKHSGMIADLLEIIKKSTQLNLIEVKSATWTEAVNKVKEKKADMFSAVGVTDERKKYLNFTSKTLFSVPYVFVSRQGEDYSLGFDNISDKVIGVSKNLAIQEIMEKEYPDIKLKLIGTEDVGPFEQLRNKEIDIFIVNYAKANFYIEKQGFSDLHIAYKTDLNLDLKIAVNKNIPNEVLTILDKSISLINHKTVSNLLFKYTNSDDTFTNEEKRYLHKKKSIKICTNPNWEPIEFTEEDKTKGISIDILDMVKNKLNLEYEFIKTESWKESRKFLKERKCDILPSAVKTPKGEIYANFTKPYLKYDFVIITHKDSSEVRNLEQIVHQKMSRREGSALIEKLKKQYPNIYVEESESTLESFQLVENGTVDFTISTLPVFLYHKSKYGLKNIKLAGYTSMKYNLSMAVRNDDRLMLSVFEKVLAEIPEATIKLIHDKWSTPKTINKIDWDLMIKVVSFFGVFILVSIFWLRKLAVAKSIAEKATVKAEMAQLEADASKKEVEIIHKQTRDSIQYAALIQGAVVSDESELKAYFKDSFVYWEPKDTVGGDIWLFNKLRHDDECLLFFIDCTGHGVPGAFVTMIVKAVEREITAKINDNPNLEVSPAWVMEYFNRTMKVLLKQETKESISNAGWDGGVIYYNRKQQILKFAGAETPLFYMTKEGELKTVKGNRYSVGYKKCAMDYKYKEIVLDVEEGMKFYCTTDGYLDQNGGIKDFPFGKRRFTNIIKENYLMSMQRQKKLFINEMTKYEEMIVDNDRNDDITLIAFEIGKKS